MGVGKEISKLLYLEKSCSDFETLLHALRGRGRCLVIHELGIYQPTQIIQPCVMAALLKRYWDGENKGKGYLIFHTSILFIMSGIIAIIHHSFTTGL